VSTVKRTRAEARVDQIETIKDVSRRLLAEKGVTGLSLREVAREMGLVSSALYRYFANRDELLTALILDAYNDLGDAVQRADRRSAALSSRRRWHAATRAIRRWAKAHPHEYALIYGTPVPNYVAPELTIAAATRVSGALAKILSDDWARRPTRKPAPSEASLRTFLMVDNVREQLPGVPPDQWVTALTAWTLIFGFINFELFGQYVGTVRNADVMFERVMDKVADSLDLGA
jgi:AcrR family transcriptional regulator